MPAGVPSYYEVLTAAVNDLVSHGYDSEARLEFWLRELRRSAERDFVPEQHLVADVARSFNQQFARLVERGDILKLHPGVSRFTLDRIKPELRDELSRRIMASANLIKLQREEAIAQTLRRFSGWASSVPPGGSPEIARNPVKVDIRKSLARTPYEVRRCAIDQGHKLASNINAIVAEGSGAICAKWSHHYVRYPRPEHVARDGKIFLIRNSWAYRDGFVKPGKPGFTDEVEQPSELPMCRCTYTFYVYLRQLPADMLTAKGKEALLETRERMGMMRGTI